MILCYKHELCNNVVIFSCQIFLLFLGMCNIITSLTICFVWLFVYIFIWISWFVVFYFFVERLFYVYIISWFVFMYLQMFIWSTDFFRENQVGILYSQKLTELYEWYELFCSRHFPFKVKKSNSCINLTFC